MAILCLVIILIGAALRLSQYISDRSLWRDEAALALNIVNRSFIGLAQPLDGDQGAPLGFLFGQKLLTVLLGNSDYVLRIIPLICGLASIWAMYALAKRVFLERIAIVAAVVLFAVSVPLIYFASESKQYSSDVLVCLLLLLVIVRNFDRNLANRDAVLLAALGSVALWASYPALFILAGAGSTLAAHFILNRDRRSALKLGCVAGLWLVSLLLLYFICLYQLSANRYLLAYWNGTFMPLPPWRDWRWFMNTLRSIVAYPIDLPTNSTIALLVCGTFSVCARRLGVRAHANAAHSMDAGSVCSSKISLCGSIAAVPHAHHVPNRCRGDWVHLLAFESLRAFASGRIDGRVGNLSEGSNNSSVSSDNLEAPPPRRDQADNVIFE